MEKAKQDAFDHARLQVIQDGYKSAFECINQGLSADEAGDKTHALELYQRGRRHLLRAVSVPSTGDECVGAAWNSAREMQTKMQETLDNITTRVAILETNSEAAPESRLYPEVSDQDKPHRPPQRPPQPSVASSALGVPALPVSPASQHRPPAGLPPAYSPQAADGHLSLSYGTDSGEMSAVGEDFYSQCPSPSPQSLAWEDGEELLYIPQGFTHEATPNRPPAFLQVCDWLYPLVSLQSPVLLCSTGVFMFPDMMAPAPGYFVGVVLSSELPGPDRDLFQDLLSQMTDLRVQAPEEVASSINLSQKVPLVSPQAPPEGEEGQEGGEEGLDKTLPEWSEKVAHGIITGASWLSWGLVKGAEFTGKAIHKGASKLREHITPEDRPSSVSPTVTKSLQVAKQATGGAVKVSQFLVDGVCTVTGFVGRELAPHVKKHGEKLIPESMKKDKDGRSNMDGAMVVAASGVQGFATMWTGLEVAAKNIATSVATETVSTVKHKYGAEAGQATDHAVNSAINVGITAFNIDNLGIKAVVKKTGKETAKAILQDYRVEETPGTSHSKAGKGGKEVERREGGGEVGGKEGKEVERSGAKEGKEVERSGGKEGKEVERSGGKEGKEVERSGGKEGKEVERSGGKEGKEVERSGGKEGKEVERSGGKEGKEVERSGGKEGKEVERSGGKEGKEVERSGGKEGKEVERSGGKEEKEVERSGGKEGKEVERSGGKEGKEVERSGGKEGKEVERSGGKEGKEVERSGGKEGKEVERSGGKEGKEVERSGGKEGKEVERSGGKEGKEVERSGGKEGKEVERSGGKEGKEVERSGAKVGKEVERSGGKGGKEVERSGGKEGKEVERSGGKEGKEVERSGGKEGKEVERSGGKEGKEVERSGGKEGKEVERSGGKEGKEVERSGGKEGKEVERGRGRNCVRGTGLDELQPCSTAHSAEKVKRPPPKRPLPTSTSAALLAHFLHLDLLREVHWRLRFKATPQKSSDQSRVRAACVSSVLSV
uniref:Spartin n=1 Tax=Knipowitschia caucasica TaxID=637954 RepID=A0AAV2J3K3_KNICA